MFGGDLLSWLLPAILLSPVVAYTVIRIVLARRQRVQRSAHASAERSLMKEHGLPEPAIQCPHCGRRGKIRVKRMRKTSLNQQARFKRFFCQECKAAWEENS